MRKLISNHISGTCLNQNKIKVINFFFSIKPASTRGIVLSFSSLILKFGEHKSQDSCSKSSKNCTKLFFSLFLHKKNKV